MTIGIPTRFAIQYSVEEHTTPWRNGKFSYLIFGAVVGDYESGTSLATAAAGVRRLLKHANARFDDELAALSTSDAYWRIRSALFNDDERTDDQVESDREHFARFDVASYLDVFDRWHCFLIEVDGRGRLLYAEISDNETPREIALEQGEFDRVCVQFLEDVESQLRT